MGVPLASVAAPQCGQVLDDGGPHLVTGLEPGLVASTRSPGT